MFAAWMVPLSSYGLIPPSRGKRLRPTRIRDGIMKKAICFLLSAMCLVLLASCGGGSASHNDKEHCDNSEQTAPQEEVCVFPNITEKGVDPFLVKSTMLDIPAKGSFYDTIIINKYYDWYEESGEGQGKGCTESEYKYYYDMFNGEIIVERCYGLAKIVKGRDTVLTVEYDENAKITNVTVLSDKFQMENGIHVGMGASDLLKDFDARFVTQNVWSDGGSFLSNYIIIDIPSLPKHMIVFSECNSKITDFMNKRQEESGNDYDFNYVYTLPSELVGNNTVSKIKVRSTAFDCYYKYYKEF